MSRHITPSIPCTRARCAESLEVVKLQLAEYRAGHAKMAAELAAASGKLAKANAELAKANAELEELRPFRPKYKFRVEVAQTVDIEVVASTEDEAEELALRKFNEGSHGGPVDTEAMVQSKLLVQPKGIHHG